MKLHAEAFEVGDQGGRVERGRLRVHSRARQLEADGPGRRAGWGVGFGRGEGVKG